MRRFGLVLQRLVTVFSGYVVACFAASAGLHAALFATGGFDPAMLPLMAAGSFIFSIPFVALFVAFVPSLAALAAAEFLALRRASAYALLGAAVGGAVCLTIQRAGQPSPSIQAPMPAEGPLGWGFALTFVVSGAAGGLAYWLVAGQFTRSRAAPGLPAAG